MARKHPVDLKAIDFVQTLQELFERVVIINPKRNIGRDVVENVVSGEENLGPRFIKARVASGMADPSVRLTINLTNNSSR